MGVTLSDVALGRRGDLALSPTAVAVSGSNIPTALSPLGMMR